MIPDEWYYEQGVIAGDKLGTPEQGRRYEYSFATDAAARPKALRSVSTFDGGGRPGHRASTR
jgi:hypothetical protein